MKISVLTFAYTGAGDSFLQCKHAQIICYVEKPQRSENCKSTDQSDTTAHAVNVCSASTVI